MNKTRRWRGRSGTLFEGGRHNPAHEYDVVATVRYEEVTWGEDILNRKSRYLLISAEAEIVVTGPAVSWDDVRHIELRNSQQTLIFGGDALVIKTQWDQGVAAEWTTRLLSKGRPEGEVAEWVDSLPREIIIDTDWV